MILTHIWPWKKFKDIRPGMDWETVSGYSHAKFERPPLHSVRQKANIKVAVKSENMWIISLEYTPVIQIILCILFLMYVATTQRLK